MDKKSGTKKKYESIQVSSQAFFLKRSGTLVEYKPGNEGDAVFGTNKGKRVGEYEVANWGENNQLPTEIMKMVYQNHLKPQLLETEECLHNGLGIEIFKKTIQDGKTQLQVWPEDDTRQKVQEFLEKIGWDELQDQIDSNLIHSRNAFVHFLLNAAGKIDELISYDFTDCRCQVMNDQGEIENILIHGNWAKVVPDEIEAVPRYYPGMEKIDPDDSPDPEPDKYKPREFIIHIKNHIPGNPYYGAPAWWGTKKWTEVSNQIPKFHYSGLVNGYNIRYHIEIPESYFSEYAGDKDKLKTAKEELQQDMDDFLAGSDNNQKAFFSTFATDYNGKPISGWKFNKMDGVSTDEAYIKLDAQANINHASGHGVHPGIAGIDTGGKLGGSGSELRVAIDTFRITKSPKYRKLKYKVLNLIRKIEGWPADMVFSNIDIELTTLDVNPTGRQNSTQTTTGIPE